jgi:hypothetical protein
VIVAETTFRTHAERGLLLAILVSAIKSFSLSPEFLYTSIKNRQHELLDQCDRLGLPRMAGGEMHGWMIRAEGLGGG